MNAVMLRKYIKTTKIVRWLSKTVKTFQRQMKMGTFDSLNM